MALLPRLQHDSSQTRRGEGKRDIAGYNVMFRVMETGASKVPR